MLPSGYNSPQSTQYQSSIQTGVSSSASSPRPQQKIQPGDALGDASRRTYLRDTFEHESVLRQLLFPPSPPPSIDQILSAESGNNGSQRPIPTPDSNSSYESLYEDIERELFAEPGSRSPQPRAGAIPAPNSKSVKTDTSNIAFPAI